LVYLLILKMKIIKKLNEIKSDYYKRKIQKVISTSSYKEALSEVIIKKCYGHLDPSTIETKWAKKDVEDNLLKRILDVENNLIPWINDVYDFSGKTILEIGCGTGSMTIPFALRAKNIIACDVWETIDVAGKRANLFGCDNVNFILHPFDWASDEKVIRSFLADFPKVDMVTMDAVLEHLTISERLNLLKEVWDFLPPGGVLVIYETPNRLFYYDAHTFLLPFINSLPDELAVLYAKNKSPRKEFLDELEQENWQTRLYKAGRGVSYHEFELSIDFNKMKILNDGYSALLRNRQDDEYCQVLKNIFKKHIPHIPNGFTKEYIDLIIQKIKE